MGTYLKVTIKKEVADTLNEKYRTISGTDKYLFPTQKELDKEFAWTLDNQKKGWDNTGWGHLPLNIENFGPAWRSFVGDPNTLSSKISSYEEEDMVEFNRIYNIIRANHQQVVETQYWKRFVVEVMEKELDEIDMFLIGLEKEEEEPEKLPVSEQNLYTDKDWYNGKGLLLVETYSATKFWLVLANVEEPSFVRTKEYEDDLYNKFVKDKDGNAYVKVPLVPLDNTCKDKIDSIYDRLFELGMREEYIMFLQLMYRNFVLIHLEKDRTRKAIAQEWADRYSKDLLKKRYEFYKKQVHNQKGAFDEPLFWFVQTLKQALK